MQETINTRVLGYVLKHKEETGAYPTAKKVAEELGIGKTTAQKYMNLFRKNGIIETKKEKLGEEQVYEFIMKYEAENGVQPTEKVIAESMKKARSTVREHIIRMVREGKIENKNHTYSMPEEKYKRSIRSQRDEKRIEDGIRREDIERVRRRIKRGDRVFVEDGRIRGVEHGEFIRPVYARVESVHETVVCLSDCPSCTLQQIAAGEKRKPEAGKKSKTWIAVRWRNQYNAIMKQ